MMHAKDLLRLSFVYRWSIVDMTRRQSVAEHSYNVWAIAREIYAALFTTPVNSLDAAMLERWALLHDAIEAWTGDIATPVKRKLGGVEALEENLLHQIDAHDVLGLQRGVKGTLIECVVAIADTIEAILFLERYMVDRREAEPVRVSLVRTLRNEIRRMRSGIFLVHDVPRFEAAIESIMNRNLTAELLSVQETET